MEYTFTNDIGEEMDVVAESYTFLEESVGFESHALKEQQMFQYPQALQSQAKKQLKVL